MSKLGRSAVAVMLAVMLAMVFLVRPWSRPDQANDKPVILWLAMVNHTITDLGCSDPATKTATGWVVEVPVWARDLKRAQTMQLTQPDGTTAAAWIASEDSPWSAAEGLATDTTAWIDTTCADGQCTVTLGLPVTPDVEALSFKLTDAQGEIVVDEPLGTAPPPPDRAKDFSLRGWVDGPLVALRATAPGWGGYEDTLTYRILWQDDAGPHVSTVQRPGGFAGDVHHAARAAGAVYHAILEATQTLHMDRQRVRTTVLLHDSFTAVRHCDKALAQAGNGITLVHERVLPMACTGHAAPDDHSARWTHGLDGQIMIPRGALALAGNVAIETIPASIPAPSFLPMKQDRPDLDALCTDNLCTWRFQIPLPEDTATWPDGAQLSVAIMDRDGDTSLYNAVVAVPAGTLRPPSWLETWRGPRTSLAGLRLTGVTAWPTEDAAWPVESWMMRAGQGPLANETALGARVGPRAEQTAVHLDLDRGEDSAPYVMASVLAQGGGRVVRDVRVGDGACLPEGD